MKASAKLRYGLQLMLELALQNGRGPILVGTIAERQQLPKKFLHVLMGSLKAAGLVRVQRGPSGGCELARRPDRITVLEITEALEGRGEAGGDLPSETPGARAVGEIWGQSLLAQKEVLRRTTLADLASRHHALDAGSDAYSI